MPWVWARPLPWTIVAMALLLAVKANTLLQASGGAAAALGTAGRAMVPAAQASNGPAAPIPPAPPAAPASPAEPPISEAERKLLLDLRTRRVALESQEQGLAAREAVLAATEKRLLERVDQLSALQARLEQMDAARRERDEANWRGLVKTYEAMRPRDAAAILNDMEMPVLLEVLDRMKEAKAAPILAAMLPERARAATAQLAQMRTRQVAPPTLPASGGQG